MHTNVIWLGVILLLTLGGITVFANKGAAVPVTLYSTQSAADTWQWHRETPLPLRWFGVVGSAAELQALLATHPFLSNRASVQIDWSKEALVIAALGEAPTGGYAVRIKQVTRTGHNVRVTLQLRSPGPTDIVTQMITYPVDTIRLSKDQLQGTSMRWEFVDQRGVSLCSFQWSLTP